MRRVLPLLAMLLAAPLAGCVGGSGDAVIVGAATSLRDTGLADVLADGYAADTGGSVRIVHGGSGELAALARRGDVDALVTHHPDAEAALVQDGVADGRHAVMENHFLLVGPPSDPAAVRAAADAGAALSAVHAHGAVFASRGDGSGTHARERALWRGVGLDPATFDAAWYRETGQGQGGTLRYAAETDAYTLVDEATWRTLHAKGRTGDLGVLHTDPENLTNVYRVLPVAGSGGGAEFAAWMTTTAAAARIAAHHVAGEPLFRPTADPEA